MGYVFGVLLLCILPVVIHSEAIRLQGCYAKCRKLHDKNMLLLASDVCRDQMLRLELDGQHVGCSKAELELDIGLPSCSLHRWFHEGEFVALYNRIFKSQLMLLVLILVPILFAIKMRWTNTPKKTKSKTRIPLLEAAPTKDSIYTRHQKKKRTKRRRQSDYNTFFHFI